MKKKRNEEEDQIPRKIEKEAKESSNLIVSDFIFLPLGVHVSEIKRNTKKKNKMKSNIRISKWEERMNEKKKKRKKKICLNTNLALT